MSYSNSASVYNICIYIVFTKTPENYSKSTLKCGNDYNYATFDDNNFIATFLYGH